MMPRMKKSGSLMLVAAALLATTPVVPIFGIRRRRDHDGFPGVPAGVPDNRGRRAEKDAIALAKAEARRRRRAEKRLKAPQ